MVENLLDGLFNFKRVKFSLFGFLVNDSIDFGLLFDLENDFFDELIFNGGELGFLNSGNFVLDVVFKYK